LVQGLARSLLSVQDNTKRTSIARWSRDGSVAPEWEDVVAVVALITQNSQRFVVLPGVIVEEAEAHVLNGRPIALGRTDGNDIDAETDLASETLSLLARAAAPGVTPTAGQLAKVLAMRRPICWQAVCEDAPAAAGRASPATAAGQRRDRAQARLE